MKASHAVGLSLLLVGGLLCCAARKKRARKAVIYPTAIFIWQSSPQSSVDIAPLMNELKQRKGR